MSRVSSKLAKPTEKRKLIKELKITETDIEFLLTAIKNSMIPGASLEQAVVTIEKLQNIYTELQKSNHQHSAGSSVTKSVLANRKAQNKQKEEQEEEN